MSIILWERNMSVKGNIDLFVKINSSYKRYTNYYHARTCATVRSRVIQLVGRDQCLM